MIYKLLLILIFLTLFFAARYTEKQATQGKRVLGRKITPTNLIVLWIIQLVGLSFSIYTLISLLCYGE